MLGETEVRFADGSDRPRHPGVLVEMATSRIAGRARQPDSAGEVEEAVFAATDSLLEQHPMAAISVSQIVREAGISRTTFYYHFTSKFDVIATLLVRSMEQVTSPVAPVLKAQPSAEGWDALKEVVLDRWRAHAPMLRAASAHWQEDPVLHEAWLNALSRAVELFAKAIDEQRAGGVARPGIDSRKLASIIVGAGTHALTVAEASGENLEDALAPVYEMVAFILYE